MKLNEFFISVDEHVQEQPEVWTKRLPRSKWGSRIPHIEETSHGRERWVVDGSEIGLDGVADCGAAMPDRTENPQRWFDVPASVYDPKERLKAMDEAGIDYAVLYPTVAGSGGQTFGRIEDPEFEVACVRAYNDWLIEDWAGVSERFIPLAVMPFMSPIETIVAEAERAVEAGHMGINMLADPSVAAKGLKSLGDAFWHPLWDACQQLGIGVHLHASAGLAGQLSLPRWEGFTRRQSHCVSTLRNFCTATQIIPFLIFSGMLERFPRLNWVFAETGLGWVSSVLEACDHEWQKRHLWSEGLITRPSELFRRQIFVDFWFETVGVQLRDYIGVDNILWESDFPHITSTFPNSCDDV